MYYIEVKQPDSLWVVSNFKLVVVFLIIQCLSICLLWTFATGKVFLLTEALFSFSTSDFLLNIDYREKNPRMTNTDLKGQTNFHFHCKEFISKLFIMFPEVSLKV